MVHVPCGCDLCELGCDAEVLLLPLPSSPASAPSSRTSSTALVVFETNPGLDIVDLVKRELGSGCKGVPMTQVFFCLRFRPETLSSLQLCVSLRLAPTTIDSLSGQPNRQTREFWWVREFCARAVMTMLACKRISLPDLHPHSTPSLLFINLVRFRKLCSSSLE